jgi:hypothetical protein
MSKPSKTGRLSTMRLIDKSSLVEIFSSEAETATITATSASCSEKECSWKSTVVMGASALANGGVSGCYIDHRHGGQ